MSLVISCSNISKNFGDGPLFQNLSFGVHEGDRIGIIGRNGAGKSTFMKILAGKLEPDSGDLARKKLLKLAFVDQVSAFSESSTPRSVLAQEAQHLGMSELELAVDIESILTRVGFENLDISTSQLSGGWRKRLAIAQALLAKPDVIFLDEPTNHLDIDGILWLENLLRNADFTWVMVSHDRYFLDRTVRKTVEIDRIYPDGLLGMEGNFTSFVDFKENYLAGLAKQEEVLANKVRREVAWLQRGPQARATKAKYRIDEAHKLVGELKDLRHKLRKDETGIAFSASGRQSKRLLVAQQISKTYGDRTLFKNLSLVLAPQMTLGILGPNGCGKSTLLKVLQQHETVDEGQLEYAHQLKIVYFEQSRESLDQDLKLADALNEQGGDSVVYRGQPVHIASWAKRFQFSTDQLTRPVSSLSGGEKARVLIARLMLQDADILILDEPTNDLDIDTLEILEESLVEFPGCIVLVSHDRFLMTRLADMYVGFLPGGGTEIYADYQQWERDYRSNQLPNKGKKAATKPKPRTRTAKTVKLSYNEQREYQGMEAAILAAEERLAAAQTKTELPEVLADSSLLNEAYVELQKSQDQVEALYERWSELEAKVKGEANGP